MITKKEAETIQGIALLLAADEPDYMSEWCGVVSEIEDAFGVTTDSGAYRIAFILDNVVIKMSKEQSRSRKLVAEAKFIEKMRKDKTYGRHFPQTEILKIGNVTLQIQEKVDMSHKGMSYEMMDEAENLGFRLGIQDIHDGNYGWKIGPNGAYPVFVDVDFRDAKLRAKPRQRRSWMR